MNSEIAAIHARISAQTDPACILVVSDVDQKDSDVWTGLSALGFDLVAAGDAAAALEQCRRRRFALVVVESPLAGASGIDILRNIKSGGAATPVIIVSATPEVSEAVAAIQNGAADYLTHPVDQAHLAAGIRLWMDDRPPAPEHSGDRGAGATEETAFVSADPKVLQVLETAQTVAGTKANVLITGESGTGKEVLARLVHRLAGNPQAPYVALNCAALPESLIESELFGHEKGSFTGAVQRKAGKFEQARDGVLVLDEISEMPLALQAKLLRVLQERKIERLGGEGAIPVQAQIIAITNTDLPRAIRAGRFREDLYFRINVIPLHLPPLRERREDIPLLLQHFVKKYAQRYHKRPTLPCAEAMQSLQHADWPGNVRELENLVERAVLLGRGARLELDLPGGTSAKRPPEADDVIKAGVSVHDMEKRLICKTLTAVNENRARAAEMLGISIRTLRNKIREYKQQLDHQGEAVS